MGGRYMVMSKVSMHEKADDFIRQFRNEPDCLTLIRFFGMHPHMRFSRLAILQTLGTNGCKSGIEKALKHLMELSVVEEGIEGEFPVYYLSSDEAQCCPVMELATLDRSKWNVIASSRHDIRC